MTTPQASEDDGRSAEEVLAELGALRRECDEYKKRLAEQQEALVELSLKRNEEFIMLYSLLEFSKSIATPCNIGALFEGAIRLLEGTFGLSAVTIFTLQRESGQFELSGSSIRMIERSTPVTICAADPLVYPVLQSGQVCLVDGLRDTAGEFCRRFVPEMNAGLCAPMLSHGEVGGVIAAFGTAADCFSDRHFQIMSAVAAHLAIGIESSELHARVQMQALTDELTGLLNRRALDDRLQEETARAGRHHQPLCLLMIDVDHFKEYNDHYGHDSGDLVLQRIGCLLRQTVRCDDICARYGGEEFAVILPQTDVELAHAVALRIRQVVEDGSTASEGKQLWRRVTVSIGVAVADGRLADCARTLLHQADQALYRAKTEGRNRVCVFSDSVAVS